MTDYKCKTCGEIMHGRGGQRKHYREKHPNHVSTYKQKTLNPTSALDRLLVLEEQVRTIYKELEAERDTLLNRANVLTAKMEEIKRKSQNGRIFS